MPKAEPKSCLLLRVYFTRYAMASAAPCSEVQYIYIYLKTAIKSSSGLTASHHHFSIYIYKYNIRVSLVNQTLLRFCLAMEIEEGSPSPPEICSNILESTKKRKLQSEQFELPSSKHKCLDQGFTPSIRDITKEDIDLVEESKSQHESAKDSNSFAEDSDCAMSSHQHQQYLCETIEEHLLEFGFGEDYGCFESENDCFEKMVDEEVLEDPYAVNRNSYILSSGRFDTIRDTTAKPTIDREFEDYFSELMM